MHPFDKWFVRTYPDAPPGTREAALAAWNAAIDAARERLLIDRDRHVVEENYDHARVLRDAVAGVGDVVRVAD